VAIKRTGLSISIDNARQVGARVKSGVSRTGVQQAPEPAGSAAVPPHPEPEPEPQPAPAPQQEAASPRAARRWTPQAAAWAAARAALADGDAAVLTIASSAPAGSPFAPPCRGPRQRQRAGPAGGTASRARRAARTTRAEPEPEPRPAPAPARARAQVQGRHRHSPRTIPSTLRRAREPARRALPLRQRFKPEQAPAAGGDATQPRSET
jgi:hypothetical protein